VKGSLNFLPSFSLFFYCFKVRTTFILFTFENFSILRFKVMFEYYEKIDFYGYDDCKGIGFFFFFVKIKFRSMNKYWVSERFVQICKKIQNSFPFKKVCSARKGE